MKIPKLTEVFIFEGPDDEDDSYKSLAPSLDWDHTPEPRQKKDPMQGPTRLRGRPAGAANKPQEPTSDQDELRMLRAAEVLLSWWVRSKSPLAQIGRLKDQPVVASEDKDDVARANRAQARIRATWDPARLQDTHLATLLLAGTDFEKAKKDKNIRVRPPSIDEKGMQLLLLYCRGRLGMDVRRDFSQD